MLLYQIVHIETGYRYVGQTSRPFVERQREHLYSLRSNKHPNRYLQSAWTKYGESAFKFEILKEFNSLDELNKAEIEYIKNNNDLYNLSEGGNGYQHDKKTKKRIGDVQKRPIVGMNVKTGEIKEYPSAKDAEMDGFNSKSIGGACALYEYKSKGKQFKRISVNGFVWMYKSEFDIKEMNRRKEMAIKGKIRLERPVMGMNVLSKEIVSFKSGMEASRNGFSNTVVGGCCLGRVKMHKGYVWVFGDIEDPQSLLLEKREEYVNNPPKTGFKSW